MLRTRMSLLILSLLIFTITATNFLIAGTRDKCCIMLGDWDHDGFITISDLTYITQFINSGGSGPYCWEEGNIDADPFNRINQKDLQSFIDYFPGGGPCVSVPPADTLTGISISLIGIDGLISDLDTISTINPVTYYFGVQNNASHVMNNISNSFQIYSPDGAQWNTASGSLNDVFNSYYYSHINSISTGEGIDVVGFDGYSTGGLPIGYNDSAFSITIGPFEPSMIGKTICIDSIDLPPNGAWLWNTNIPFKAVIPEWDGPHCFVVGPCCNHDGIRGDADLSNQINVADLTFLVNYIFKGGPLPPCMAEGDVNADGIVLVDDLTLMVNYIFKGGLPPAGC